tara:strand:- start:96 stop:1382 length:1287 start_codon:yes stop_codon:yes gene_type:complete
MNIEFEKRRKQIMKMVGLNAAVIVPSAMPSKRNRDVDYLFRQDSDFYYLSGFEEPNSLIILIPERVEGEFILFCQKKDQLKEKWDGPISGPEGAIANYDVNEAYPIEKIDEILPKLISGKEFLYCPVNINREFDQNINNWTEINSKKNNSKPEIISVSHLLHDMRLYKSQSEISVMRKAAKISAIAHRRAMTIVKPDMYEFELEAEFIHEFRKYNANHAYNPIVGGGKNACILHYISNDSILNDGDLVLIDAGCELSYYASDITRTFPVNGKFSPEQRDIYNIVLNAQKAAILSVKQGNQFSEPHDTAVKIITEGLKDIGLLQGSLSSLIEKRAYNRFFMHRTGHWIGMDVHDVGDYMVEDQWRLFENGMVTTIEPGIYIDDGEDIPRNFRNIGIRIEDMVLVKNNTPDILSKNIEKELNCIEDIINN